ncbi:MAG: hypothetical protein WEB37_03560 [Bacteroidota bacterium]
MEIWKFIWIAALIVGFVGFVWISTKVIARGFAEMRDLLKSL